MPSVLILGVDPHTLSIPGLDPDALRSALDRELTRFAAKGVDAAVTVFPIDGTAERTIIAALRERNWDVVVVGGGVRKPEQLTEFFELIVNLIRIHAPGAAIAFNHSAADCVEAAWRWLSRC
jgi:hypothetical protein